MKFLVAARQAPEALLAVSKQLGFRRCRVIGDSPLIVSCRTRGWVLVA